MSKYELHDLEHNTVLELELTDEQFGELKRFLKELKKPCEGIDSKHILGVDRQITAAVRAEDLIKV